MSEAIKVNGNNDKLWSLSRGAFIDLVNEAKISTPSQGVIRWSNDSRL